MEVARHPNAGRDAVLFGYADLVLVVGLPNSANSNRLRELAEKQGVPAYLMDGVADMRPNGLKTRPYRRNRRRLSPGSLVRDVIAHLSAAGASCVRELDGEPENVTFALPKELRLRVVA